MDKIINDLIKKEKRRQKNVINLIASENYVSNDILKLQGSIFTNKYAEGYPGKRYYGGCEVADDIENLAIKYACQLFCCNYANVQSHSGSSANMAVYRALLNPNDVVLSMSLTDGGHLTHGHNINFSGIDYKIIHYKVNHVTGLLDYENIKQLAIKHHPKLIIAGFSAYPRIINFKKFREIADLCGAYLMVDIAHIAGLLAAGLHPSPFPYADVVTSTTHKTLRGPRGGLILSNDEILINKINKAIFPGIQGGPLIHVIAAKAQCFYEALQPQFKDYQTQVLKNIKAMEKVFNRNGYHLITGGTDNHLLLIDVYNSLKLTGKEVQNLLEEINIIVNKNTIPNETLSPFLTSGIRIGSPAMTSKNFKEEDFRLIAELIVNALNTYIHNNKDLKSNKAFKKNVNELIKKVLI